MTAAEGHDIPSILGLLRMLAPEGLHSAIIRAQVMDAIREQGPIGRRTLAQNLDMTEREVRAAVDHLRQVGCVQIESGGMSLTRHGNDTLPEVRTLLRAMLGHQVLEDALKQALPVDRAIVVRTEADRAATLRLLGAAASAPLLRMLHNGHTLAITGGSTMAALAEALPNANLPGVLVVPARGGMGRSVEHQAGTLASTIAHKLGGRHRLLHMPDDLSADALREMLKREEIRDTLDRLKNVDVLVYGIGRADVMVRRRHLEHSIASLLLESGAKAEAVGTFFDIDGRAIYTASRVGLQSDDLLRIGAVIALAEGEEKANAVLAVLRHHRHTLLVVDETCAQAILRQLDAEASAFSR